MTKYDWLKFGFFFTDPSPKLSLYLACFQRGRSFRNAHQVIIAEVLKTGDKTRKVAYMVNSELVMSHAEHELENFCRIAVTQFLGKLPSDNFYVGILALDMSQAPWSGAVHAV